MKQRPTQSVARNSGDSGFDDQGQATIRWQAHSLDPALCILKCILLAQC